jgi:DNA-directed RNA polymerase subunit F
LAAEPAAPTTQKKMLTLSEAHQILEKIDLEKADQIQKRTLDYTTKFAKNTPEASRKLKKQLETECGLSEGESVEVVNIMPKSIEELRTFTAGWRKLLPTETLEKILKILKSGVLHDLSS